MLVYTTNYSIILFQNNADFFQEYRLEARFTYIPFAHYTLSY